MENLIIHISGASGSGKTTLGNKLKEHFKSKIIVKDLDELLDEHFIDYFGKKSSHNIGDLNEKAYQKYIDDYINKQKKPIIFVGLNDNFVDFYPKRKNIYYNLLYLDQLVQNLYIFYFVYMVYNCTVNIYLIMYFFPYLFLFHLS